MLPNKVAVANPKINQVKNIKQKDTKNKVRSASQEPPKAKTGIVSAQNAELMNTMQQIKAMRTGGGESGAIILPPGNQSQRNDPLMTGVNLKDTPIPVKTRTERSNSPLTKKVNAVFDPKVNDYATTKDINGTIEST